MRPSSTRKLEIFPLQKPPRAWRRVVRLRGTSTRTTSERNSVETRPQRRTIPSQKQTNISQDKVLKNKPRLQWIHCQDSTSIYIHSLYSDICQNADEMTRVYSTASKEDISNKWVVTGYITLKLSFETNSF